MNPVKRICGNCSAYCSETSKCEFRNEQFDSDAVSCTNFFTAEHLYKEEVERLERVIAGVEAVLREDGSIMCDYCKHKTGNNLKCDFCSIGRFDNFEFPDG